MLAVLALVGLSLGFSRVKDWRAAVEMRAATIELEEAEAWELLAERELWEARASYLDQELPDYPGRSTAVSELLGALEGSARAAGLEVAEQRITELDPSPHRRSSACELQVKGSFDAVGRWMLAIQTDRPFREVRELRLMGDKKTKSVVSGTVLVVQYFKPEEGS